MPDKIFRFLFYLNVILSLVSCADSKSDEGDFDSGLIEVIDGGRISPGDTTSPQNPRYPELKTYSTITKGFFSIISGTSYTLDSTQTFFGFSSYNDTMVLSLRNSDSSGLKWINIYQLNNTTKLLNFICSIRDDGNFRSEFDVDDQNVYIRNNSHPVRYRRFSLLNCTEKTALTEPSIPYPWSTCQKWDVMGGLLNMCQYSTATGYTIREYNESTGSTTTITTAPEWADLRIGFNESKFSRSERGIWGLQGKNYDLNIAVYFIDPKTNVNTWGILPSSDYPDFSYNGNTDLYATISDDKNLFILSATDSLIRIYHLDVESF